MPLLKASHLLPSYMAFFVPPGSIDALACATIPRPLLRRQLPPTFSSGAPYATQHTNPIQTSNTQPESTCLAANREGPGSDFGFRCPDAGELRFDSGDGGVWSPSTRTGSPLPPSQWGPGSAAPWLTPDGPGAAQFLGVVDKQKKIRA